MTTPSPRQVPRLLLPLPVATAPAARSCTACLVIELARVRAAAITMANALGAVAIASNDADVAAFAAEALEQAEQLMS